MLSGRCPISVYISRTRAHAEVCPKFVYRFRPTGYCAVHLGKDLRAGNIEVLRIGGAASRQAAASSQLRKSSLTPSQNQVIRPQSLGVATLLRPRAGATPRGLAMDV
jgi:hypothetical protein